MKCKVKDCENKIDSKQLCHKHYQHLWSTGSLEYKQKFADRVKKAELIRLHTKLGLSTHQIAKKLGVDRTTITHSLKASGVLKKNMGYDAEMRVGEWLDSRGVFAIHQKGNAPYDYLIGKKRVDVKMAHRTTDGRYSFEIFHDEAINKKTSRDVDSLYLVFMDDLETPIYELAFSEVEHLTRHLNIRDYNSTKYPLQLIGYLDRI